MLKRQNKVIFIKSACLHQKMQVIDHKDIIEKKMQVIGQKQNDSHQQKNASHKQIKIKRNGLKMQFINQKMQVTEYRYVSPVPNVAQCYKRMLC